jgi:hypothetical protein
MYADTNAHRMHSIMICISIVTPALRRFLEVLGGCYSNPPSADGNHLDGSTREARDLDERCGAVVVW